MPGKGNKKTSAYARLLKQLRESGGLTQEQLADRAGLHRTYISLIERNERSPTLTTLVRLCEALGVDFAAFLRDLADEVDQ